MISTTLDYISMTAPAVAVLPTVLKAIRPDQATDSQQSGKAETPPPPASREPLVGPMPF
jgi:hypothetical protein